MVNLVSVSIDDFKNVEHGAIVFDVPTDESGCGVTGIYGQNGSGKTAVLNALELLKISLCGLELPDDAGELVTAGSDHAHFQWTFRLFGEDEPEQCEVEYGFDLRPFRHSIYNEKTGAFKGDTVRGAIENESIGVRVEGKRRRLIVDTGRGDIFGPAKQYGDLTGGRGILKGKLFEAKKRIATQGKSFVFTEIIKVAEEASRNKMDTAILQRLKHFALSSLFVLTARDVGIAAFDQMVIQSRSFPDSGHISLGIFYLPFDKPLSLKDDEVEAFQRLLMEMSRVLSKIVPGLTMELRIVDSKWDEEAKEMRTLAQVVSRKGPRELSFRLESDGIKKIVGILQLLMVIYNQNGVVLAVDELDSGIHEYLLGELLRIMAAEGEGQLIFTSHNLRPLEVLDDRKHIVYTTVDPANRYVRRNDQRPSNNARKSYLREIQTQDGKVQLFEEISRAEIGYALQCAGESTWQRDP